MPPSPSRIYIYICFAGMPCGRGLHSEFAYGSRALATSMSPVYMYIVILLALSSGSVVVLSQRPWVQDSVTHE